MLERFTETKPIESKDVIVKRLAKEMLERFRARFKRGEKIEPKDEPATLPESSPKEIKVDEEQPEITIGTEETGISVETESQITPEEKPEESKSVKEVHKKEREIKTDRGNFESVTTNNFFEGWDEDLELEGNPELKEQIRQNIIRAEKINQQRYEHAAADLGISVEEFKERLQVKVEEMVRGANFFRATQLSVLDKIMNVDGRWKSQFETQTSNGALDPGFRAASEMRMFGFNKTDEVEMPTATYGANVSDEVLQNNKEKRPIYGYFSDEEHGAINSYGKIPPPTNVTGYGAVNIKIKKERALQKATLTFHDSLGPGSEWPPTAAAKPHFASFRLSYSGGGRILNELKGPSVANWGESYTEVQYHGGLTMDDVESIHITKGNGLYPEDIEEVRRIFKKYKEQHPESTIELIEF